MQAVSLFSFLSYLIHHFNCLRWLCLYMGNSVVGLVFCLFLIIIFTAMEEVFLLSCSPAYACFFANMPLPNVKSFDIYLGSLSELLG